MAKKKAKKKKAPARKAAKKKAPAKKAAKKKQPKRKARKVSRRAATNSRRKVTPLEVDTEALENLFEPDPDDEEEEEEEEIPAAAESDFDFEEEDDDEGEIDADDGPQDVHVEIGDGKGADVFDWVHHHFVSKGTPVYFDVYRWGTFLDRISPPFNIQELKKRYGGGSYQVKVKNMNNNQFLTNAGFTIEGQPAVAGSQNSEERGSEPPAAQVAPPAPEKPNLSPLELMKFFVEQNREARQEVREQTQGQGGSESQMMAMIMTSMQTQAQNTQQAMDKQNQMMIEMFKLSTDNTNKLVEKIQDQIKSVSENKQKEYTPFELMAKMKEFEDRGKKSEREAYDRVEKRREELDELREEIREAKVGDKPSTMEKFAEMLIPAFAQAANQPPQVAPPQAPPRAPLPAPPRRPSPQEIEAARRNRAEMEARAARAHQERQAAQAAAQSRPVQAQTQTARPAQAPHLRPVPPAQPPRTVQPGQVRTVQPGQAQVRPTVIPDPPRTVIADPPHGPTPVIADPPHGPTPAQQAQVSEPFRMDSKRIRATAPTPEQNAAIEARRKGNKVTMEPFASYPPQNIGPPANAPRPDNLAPPIEVQSTNLRPGHEVDAQVRNKTAEFAGESEAEANESVPVEGNAGQEPQNGGGNVSALKNKVRELIAPHVGLSLMMRKKAPGAANNAVAIFQKNGLTLPQVLNEYTLDDLLQTAREYDVLKNDWAQIEPWLKEFYGHLQNIKAHMVRSTSDGGPDRIPR